MWLVCRPNETLDEVSTVGQLGILLDGGVRSLHNVCVFSVVPAQKR